MIPSEETARLNPLCAAAIIQTCINNGVDHFFVAPGSRCTPLTLAVAQHPKAKVVRHFDERGLSFACVGFGRAQKMRATIDKPARPAAFICTSGTAVANALPAVIEASIDHVPMLLLTADRPPELLGVGANQAIDQNNIFGGYPTLFENVGCPESDNSIDEAAQVVETACQTAIAGPAHINLQFREPFGAAIAPNCKIAPQTVGSVADQNSGHTLPDGNTVIMLGGCSIAERTAVVRLAERTSALLFGDVTSGLRTHAYDLALIHADLPVPQNVIHLGGRVVSKRWLQFLERNSDAIEQHWHVWPHSETIDPVRTVTDRIQCDIETFCENAKTAANATTPQFVAEWSLACNAAMKSAILQMSRAGDLADQLTEPSVAHSISQLAPVDSAIFLGNSMPVRDMDMFGMWSDDRRLNVFANRGASGIDGLIATAAGVALGQSTPTTLVIGDLSALHDLNSLALLAGTRQSPIVMVVINNDGGGIFHFLPISNDRDHFEDFFGTPHGLSFEAAAKMFRIPYHSPKSVRDFEDHYSKAVAAQQTTIIEVATKRDDNIRLHREIEQAIRGSNS